MTQINKCYQSSDLLKYNLLQILVYSVHIYFCMAFIALCVNMYINMSACVNEKIYIYFTYIYISYTLSYLYVCNYLCTLVYSYFCGCGIFDCTLKNRTTNKSAQVKWPRYESLLWTTHKQGRWLSKDLRSRHVQVVFANPVSSS